LWEVDEFLGDNSGLVVAEIELENEYQTFDIPKWVGAEVSTDEKYYNYNLLTHPFKDWENENEI
jgi:CYTH domain-containing protein